MTADVVLGPCIFCGEQIPETGFDPLAIEATPRTGKPVIWFSHAKCFAERMSPAVSEGFAEPERTSWKK